MKQYNKTNAADTHYRCVTVDDRLIISTEQEIAILVNKEPMPSVMYDGMVVTLQIPKNVYLFLNKVHGNVYPEWYDDIQGRTKAV
jgi:hypothetical protein